MTAGDDAAAAGLNVYDGNETAATIYALLNERGDDIAHVKTTADAATTALAGKANTNHTHTVSQITGGTFPAARIPDGMPTSKIAALQSTLEFLITGHLDAGVHGRVLSSNYVSVYIDSTGTLGHVPSARRFKRDIEPMNESIERLLGIEPVRYRLITDADDAPLHLGFIAEDLVDAGLSELVPTDADPESSTYGEPIAINYEFYGPVLQHIARHQADQILAQQVAIERLAARLDLLEGSAA